MTGLRVPFPGCTLSRPAPVSRAQGLVEISRAAVGTRGAAADRIRAADQDIVTAVRPGTARRAARRRCDRV
jgi:hypothetical protein